MVILPAKVFFLTVFLLYFLLRTQNFKETKYMHWHSKYTGVIKPKGLFVSAFMGISVMLTA